MRKWFSYKTLTCIMAVVLPASMFAADSGAAMLYSNGNTWLNGSSLPKSLAVFLGDLIQTAPVVAKINASGSSLMVLSDSLVEFEGSGVSVEHGGVTV